MPSNKKDVAKRIVFQLEVDAEGYPPMGIETLWGIAVGPGQFRVDSIPFFVRGVSPGDIISVEEQSETLYFKTIIRHSSNSVVRVWAAKESDVRRLRQHLRSLGCQSELSHLPRLFSVEIPGSVLISTVLSFLRKEVEEGKLDYEEASIRA